MDRRSSGIGPWQGIPSILPIASDPSIVSTVSSSMHPGRWFRAGKKYLLLPGSFGYDPEPYPHRTGTVSGFKPGGFGSERYGGGTVLTTTETRRGSREDRARTHRGDRHVPLRGRTVLGWISWVRVRLAMAQTRRRAIAWDVGRAHVTLHFGACNVAPTQRKPRHDSWERCTTHTRDSKWAEARTRT